MLPNRRQMLGAIARPVLSAACAPPAPLASGAAVNVPKWSGSPEDATRDEDSWTEIGRNWAMDRSFVNLNNGGVSPAPRGACDFTGA